MKCSASPIAWFRYFLPGLLKAVAAVLFCVVGAIAQEPDKLKPFTPAFRDTTPKVLVLHSYHHGFTWSDNVSAGIRSAFEPFKDSVELRFEFMDTRRYSSPGYFEQLHAYLYAKYKTVRPDLIITSDDNALAYIIDRGQGLFKDIPVVFCSVSGYQPWMRQGRQITGLLESIDIASTLEKALELHPATQNVVVITDMTRTGRALRVKAEAVFKAYRDRVRFRYLDNLTVEELIRSVETLSTDTLIFLFNFNRDQSGRVLSHEQYLNILAEHSKVPIYSVWKYYLGHGIVGGKLTSGEAEGALAGIMALRILQGERATDIPLEKSPIRFMFDFVQLKRFDINVSAIPTDSLVINKPESVYQRYRHQIWGIILLIGVLIAAVIILLFNINQRRQVEKALRDSEKKFARAFMAVPDPILITRVEDGKIIDANEAFFTTTGRQRSEVIGKNAEEIGGWADPRDRQDFVQLLQETGEVNNMEANFRFGDGRTHPFLISARPIEVNGEDCIISVTRDIFDRKVAEQALQESEKRLRMVLDRAAVMIWAIDKNGIITFSEGSGLSALGLKAGEAVGRSLFDMYAKNEQAIADAQRALAGESFSTTVENAGLIFESTYVPIFDPDGQVEGAIGVALDVTERKKSQRALDESEQKFRNIVESSPMGMHLYKLEEDDRLIFMGANPAADTILGIDNKQFIGKTIEAAFPPLMHTEVPDQYRRICLLGDNWHTEQIDYEDNQIKGAYEVYAFQTTPGMMAAIFLDVTERKKAEDALREGEERFREMADHIREVFWLFDWVAQKVVYVSPAYENIWGRSVAALYERYEEWAESVHPDDREFAQTSFQQVLENGGGEPREYRIVRPDGSIRWISDRGFPIRDAAGNIVRITGIAEDITEKKLSIEERRGLQNQLIQAQKMEAVGTLAGGIAHDFNNLLMGIQGRTSLMLAEMDASNAHYDHLKGIETYVKSAVDLTRQLLGFARGGKYEVVPTSLNELIKGQNRMFGRTRKEISLHGKYAKDLWTVEVDQGQITQVLLNLYVNAWQAMPSGGEIFVQTRNVELGANDTQPFEMKPGRYVKISITDTGIGMDEPTRQRIFEPFFTTKNMGRGTGLGLASVYGIIKNHSGFITVSSEKGKGSTFNIFLPATAKAATGKISTLKSVMPGEGTVLLVDDEPMILEVGRQMIQRLGYNVIVAKSGESAIDMYRQKSGQIDLVILDMIMPKMDGGQTFDRLKELDPHVRVLLSSGYSINGKASEIIQRGCEGFIQKPFDLNDLSQKIKDVIGS